MQFFYQKKYRKRQKNANAKLRRTFTINFSLKVKVICSSKDFGSTKLFEMSNLFVLETIGKQNLLYQTKFVSQGCLKKRNCMQNFVKMERLILLFCLSNRNFAPPYKIKTWDFVRFCTFCCKN